MKTAFLAAIPATVVLAFVTFSAYGQTGQPTAPSGVVYINSQRILNEVASARTEVARVQAMQQEKNNEIRAKQQAIDATRQQFATAPDAETRTRLLKQEQDQRAELDRLAAQAQADVQRLQRDVQAELQARVKSALEQMSQAQNYRLVLNADTSVVWSAPGMDVTNQLIDRLNAEAAAKKP
jgi:Skp family chaperone for outer membrane proteins